MDIHDNDTVPKRREPRLGQAGPRDKADALRGVLAKELARIRKMSPTRPKESPALAVLRPQADEIRALIADGWTPNAIATEIARQHEGIYSVETLRNAIRKIVTEGSSTKVATTRPPAPSRLAPVASPTSHAGFAEDPR